MSAQHQDEQLTPAIYDKDRTPAWIQDGLRAAAPPASDEREPAVERPRPAPTRALALLLAASLLVGGGYGLGRALEDEDSAPAPPRQEKPAPAPAEPVAAVAARLLPAVVQIETNRGLGSGVIYHRRGLVLTAAHVVEQSRTVSVRLGDKRKVRGRVIGADGETDVAVVKIKATGLVPARLGTARRLRVGQLAVAIGSPFGLGGSVTSGVISAVRRFIRTHDVRTRMIQTDAPINPGNSGGALADRRGVVIGINDAIVTSSGSNAGVGFAIPIDTAAAVAEQIVNTKRKGSN